MILETNNIRQRPWSWGSVLKWGDNAVMLVRIRKSEPAASTTPYNTKKWFIYSVWFFKTKCKVLFDESVIYRQASLYRLNILPFLFLNAQLPLHIFNVLLWRQLTNQNYFRWNYFPGGWQNFPNNSALDDILSQAVCKTEVWERIWVFWFQYIL